MSQAGILNTGGSGGLGIQVIDGDTGSVSGSTVTLTGGSSGAKFTGVGTIMTESFLYLALPSTLGGLGSPTGSITINGNRFLSAFGTNNTFLGDTSGNLTLSGTNSTGIGKNALIALSSGINNVSIGSFSGNQTTTGDFNLMLGTNAGSSLAGADGSNVLIANVGTSGDANTIRIGTQGSGSGQQNRLFAAGVAGVTVSNLNLVTVNTSTGQFGSTASSIVPTGGTTGTVLIGQTGSAPVWSNTLVGNFTYTLATPGAPSVVGIIHSDNTMAGSSAVCAMLSGGSSGGSAYCQWEQAGGQGWAAGLWAGGSADWALGASQDIGVNVALRVNKTTKNAAFTAGITVSGGSLLDVFLEGTWTPTVTGSVTPGTATYAQQMGTYTRIGNRVLIDCTLEWSGGTGAGIFQVSGLPYTTNASTTFYNTAFLFGGVVGTTGFLIQTNNATTQLLLNSYNSVTGVASSTPYQAAGLLFFQMSYTL